VTLYKRSCPDWGLLTIMWNTSLMHRLTEHWHLDWMTTLLNDVSTNFSLY
jgi:hypothetical protein